MQVPLNASHLASHQNIILKLVDHDVLMFNRRVLTDHHPPDEGAGPSGIWKRDTCSFSDAEGEYGPCRESDTVETDHWLNAVVLSLRRWTPCAVHITATCAASLWLKTPSWKWNTLKCASSAFLTRFKIQNLTIDFICFCPFVLLLSGKVL